MTPVSPILTVIPSILPPESPVKPSGLSALRTRLEPILYIVPEVVAAVLALGDAVVHAAPVGIGAGIFGTDKTARDQESESGKINECRVFHCMKMRWAVCVCYMAYKWWAISETNLKHMFHNVYYELGIM